MQDNTLISHHSTEYQAMLRAMKYLPIVAIGLLALYEQSIGLLVALAVGIGFAMAFKQRIDESSQYARSSSLLHTRHVAGDGGSFPHAQPMDDTPPQHNNLVIDGGSMEHHRQD